MKAQKLLLLQLFEMRVWILQQSATRPNLILLATHSAPTISS
jgi:hypothetical protein